MGTGTKKEPSTGRIWTAGFHHIMARLCLVCVLKLMNRLFILFSIFFLHRGKLQKTETTHTESADTEALPNHLALLTDLKQNIFFLSG
jgi:hypothetical protein